MYVTERDSQTLIRIEFVPTVAHCSLATLIGHSTFSWSCIGSAKLYVVLIKVFVFESAYREAYHSVLKYNKKRLDGYNGKNNLLQLYFSLILLSRKEHIPQQLKVSCEMFLYSLTNCDCVLFLQLTNRSTTRSVWLLQWRFHLLENL